VGLAMTRTPVVTVADYVEDLAREHGVRYRRSALDDFSEAVTRLAGDNVVLDPIEELLVALRQAGAITGIERTRLHARYLRERRA
jgi:hypothetical protein